MSVKAFIFLVIICLLSVAAKSEEATASDITASFYPSYSNAQPSQKEGIGGIEIPCVDKYNNSLKNMVSGGASIFSWSSFILCVSLFFLGKKGFDYAKRKKNIHIRVRR